MRAPLRGHQKMNEERAGGAYRSTDHLHNFQVSVFLHSPILEQLHPLDNDRMSGYTSIVRFPLFGAIKRGNIRRFTPTANVCYDALERVQKRQWALQTEVHTTTLNMLFRNKSSVILRSSRVIPAWWMPMPAAESSVTVMVVKWVCTARKDGLTL